jgi:hypothetical protein
MIQHIKPPLGEIIRFHQAYEGTTVCLYCGRHIKEWKPMEKCLARYEERSELVKNK